MRMSVAPLVGPATAEMPAFSTAPRTVCWHVMVAIHAIPPGAGADLQAGVFGKTGDAAW